MSLETVLLDRVQTYMTISQLQLQLENCHPYRKHAKELNPLLKHLRKDTAKIADEATPKQIAHILFASGVAKDSLPPKKARKTLKKLLE